jgi:hypothetical protein
MNKNFDIEIMIKINTLYKLTHSKFKQAILIYMIAFAVACGQVPKSDQVIIRAGKSVITDEYLNQVLEIAKTSYPTNMSEGIIQEVREKVISELMEEVLIMERARELGITVSVKELDSAIKKIRNDYPEDTFENMLLEQAIPYSLWKKRLRKRLIIEKTIEKDIQKYISVCQADIDSFHQRFPKQSISPKGDHPLKNENVQESTNSKNLKSFLIKEKIEDRYPQWIKGLKERYGLYFSFDGKSDE